MSSFEQELTKLINCYSIDNECCIPDYFLSEYLCNCIKAIKICNQGTREWYARPQEIEERQPTKNNKQSAQGTE
jgi:hypothetical protein